MRNRYAAGALAVSAGISVFTLTSLPRGGVARSWTRSVPSAAFQFASRPSTAASPAAVASAPKQVQAQAPVVAREDAPAMKLQPAATPPASQRSSEVAPRPGAFFARRPAAPPARPSRPERRPDPSTLIVSGLGMDRVVGSAGDGGIGDAAPLGGLQSFQWQQGPRVRDDAAAP